MARKSVLGLVRTMHGLGILDTGAQWRGGLEDWHPSGRGEGYQGGSAP